MIRAYCTIAVGARLAVELKCGESVDGTALWVKDDAVGVEFDQPVDVVELLATSMQGPAPADAADRARLRRVRIRDGAATSIASSTRDVSQGGLKVASNARFAVGGDSW